MKPATLGIWLIALTLTLTARLEIDAQVARRDSAGIEVVENRNRVPGAGIRINPLPTLSIGSQAETDQFVLFRVADVMELSDGRLVVVSGVELLWFSATGQFLAKAGGRGEAPHEFRAIAAIAPLPGDSIIAVNSYPAAARWFEPSGRFVRSLPFRSTRGAPLRFTRISDGSWVGLAFGGERPPAVPGSFREDWYLVRHSIDRARADTMVVVPGEMYFGDRRRSVRITGSPQAYMSAEGGRVVLGSSGTYEFQVFNSTGRLVSIVRNALPNPPISSVPPAPRPQPSGRTTEVGGRPTTFDVPTAKSAPAFHALVAGKDGSVWLRRTPLTAPRAEWHVYDNAGTWIATVELPAKFRPTEITSSSLLGVQTDQLDVEYVVKYAYARSRPTDAR